MDIVRFSDALGVGWTSERPSAFSARQIARQYLIERGRAEAVSLASRGRPPDGVLLSDEELIALIAADLEWGLLRVAASDGMTPGGAVDWIRARLDGSRRSTFRIEGQRWAGGERRIPVPDEKTAAAFVEAIMADRMGRARLQAVVAQHLRAMTPLQSADLSRKATALLMGKQIGLFESRGGGEAKSDKADKAAQPRPVVVPGARGPGPRGPGPNQHWIEIVLKDETGQPIANEPYEITLPDGKVSKGALDGAGRARLDGVTAGQCKVSFPQIDAREWKAL